MPNVDEQGNKIAAKKEKKSILSQRIREKRIQKFKNDPENSNKNYCDVCGFRIRSENHLNGKHHKSAE